MQDNVFIDELNNPIMFRIMNTLFIAGYQTERTIRIGKFLLESSIEETQKI